MNEQRALAMAKKLILWWDSLGPETRLDPDAAHELAGIVTLAQGLVDLEAERAETEEIPRTCSSRRALRSSHRQK